MICLLIGGRAGNQFFQYAVARSLQNAFGGDLGIDFSIIKQAGYENDLQYFNTKEYYTVSIRDKFPIRWRILRLFDKIRPKSTGRICYVYDLMVGSILNLLSICYYKNDYKIKKFHRGILKNYIVFGWFESYKYFQKIDSSIRKELSVKETLDTNKISNIIKVLDNSNSVCISIRRGNFVTDEKLKDRFYCCDFNYFYRAIDRITEVIDSPTFFVCSNDLDWCKSNICLQYPMIYEEDGLKIYEKVEVMKHCHHFILSNSTFSWWVQHLGVHKDKIVISPSIWRKDVLPPKDIFEKDWIRLEND